MNIEKENAVQRKSGKPVLSRMPKRMRWLVHAILWIVILGFPFLFINRGTDEVNFFDYLRFLTMLSGVIVVFYVNYLLLVKRFLFSRQMWQFLLVNLLLFTVITLISHVVLESIPPDPDRMPSPHHHDRFVLRFIIFDYIKYTFIVALSVALRMTGSWYKAETERKELERMHSEAELQNLKSQLNPHFLFNTLNNIYSLIAISQDRAQEAVHDLSRLLRYMLYDSSQSTVPVEKDFDFLRNYIELMRIRLPKHAQLETEIETSSPHSRIAPLLFISLIENAFKHGSSNNKPCFIDIRLFSDAEKVSCRIRNSYFPKTDHDKSGSGIGIANLRKRLELLYPHAHTFICEHNGDMFISELIITLPTQ